MSHGSQNIPSALPGEATLGFPEREAMEFEPVESVAAKGEEVRACRVWSDDVLFARLYISSESYALAWKTDKLDFNNPCFFVKAQYTNMSLRQIELIDPVLPEMRATAKNPLTWEKADVKVLLKNQGGDLTFDWMSRRSQQEYLNEVVEPADAMRNLRFARYDFRVCSQARPSQVCFTIEKRKPDSSEWEFTARVPKDILLTEKTLKWIVKNHSKRESLIRSVDFERSVSALGTELRRE